MATASWPSTLSQRLEQSSFNLTIPSSWIESATDVGPKKRRRQTTMVYETFTCSVVFEKSLYTTFKNFFDVTLNGGVLPFTFPHPITQVTTKYRMAQPAITPLGGNYFTLSMTWEEVPT
jgi:hypothetical protein